MEYVTLVVQFIKIAALVAIRINVRVVLKDINLILFKNFAQNVKHGSSFILLLLLISQTLLFVKFVNKIIVRCVHRMELAEHVNKDFT